MALQELFSLDHPVLFMLRVCSIVMPAFLPPPLFRSLSVIFFLNLILLGTLDPVSYTHLTLPTKLSV